jgi:hypothetical protein
VSVHVFVADDEVDITFDGADRWTTFSSGITLAMSDIVAARVAPVDEVRPTLGWRVLGGYFPGRLTTGHFTAKDREGGRQLWCVYRDPEVLVIETRLDRPARVVLQTEDRANLAWLINERVPVG